MTRVNTNIASLTAIRSLNHSSKNLNKSLERLSTGLKINRAGDGPAKLIISERLRSQVSKLRQAVDNTERANNMVNTAEAALVEINTLLQSVQDLILESQNDGALSQEEILANQFQVDDAIQSIDRIANTTNFAGVDLLNGKAGYITSGVNSDIAVGTGIIELNINGAAITNGTSNIQVTVAVTTGASQAVVSSTSAVLVGGASLLITGNKGAQLLNFAFGTGYNTMASAINTVTNSTGVTATNQGGSISFSSEFYGDDNFVNIKDISTPIAANQFINLYDDGSDLVGSINGIGAAATGNSLTVNTHSLDMEVVLSAGFGAATTSFSIIGGGMAFQLGSGARDSEQAFMGIERIGSDNLGGHEAGGFLAEIVTGGKFTLLKDPETANKIMQKAIDDVSALRAKLGAFSSHTLETNVNSLQVAIENITAAESRIRDTDFAVETAEFTRLQILVQAGTAVVAQANLLPQTVLSLLA
jgi:flagellin